MRYIIVSIRQLCRRLHDMAPLNCRRLHVICYSSPITSTPTGRTLIYLLMLLLRWPLRWKNHIRLVFVIFPFVSRSSHYSSLLSLPTYQTSIKSCIVVFSVAAVFLSNTAPHRCHAMSRAFAHSRVSAHFATGACWTHGDDNGNYDTHIYCTCSFLFIPIFAYNYHYYF